MKWIALFTYCLFLFVLPSCHKKAVPLQNESSDTFCEGYYKFIKENFRPDSLGIFNRNDLFPLEKEEQTARYRNEIINQCLIGKRKDDIIVIFGNPSFSTKSRIDYYFNSNCFAEGQDPKSPSILRCVRLKIYFNNEGIVTGIPAITNESGQKQ
jgi:hypothetical protein